MISLCHNIISNSKRISLLRPLIFSEFKRAMQKQNENFKKETENIKKYQTYHRAEKYIIKLKISLEVFNSRLHQAEKKDQQTPRQGSRLHPIRGSKGLKKRKIVKRFMGTIRGSIYKS